MQAIRLRACNSGVTRTVARLVAPLVIAALLLPSAAAEGQTRRVQTIRLEGTVGPPPDGRRQSADLLIGAGDKDVPFRVTNATVLAGNLSVSGMFSSVRPLRPNFILRGRRDQIAQVAEAPIGARLRIVGQWRPGSRDLMVSSIEPQPPAEK